MRRRACWILLGFLAASAGSAADSKEPCKPSLDACPKRGCAEPYTPAAYLNIQKRRLSPLNTSIVRLTFDDFRELQARAEVLFEGKHHELSKPQRVRLRNLVIGGKPVGEGWLIELTGFITVLPAHSEPHPNSSGESVNCRLKSSDNNDFHISISPDPAVKEWQGIVVEMVPQKRSEGWTITQLKKAQKERRMLRVRGLLFFDNHHTVNADELKNIKNQPKRMSLWEIHPVKEFHVCAQNTCQPDGSGWKRLEEWP